MWLVYVFKKQAERCWSSCGVCLGVSVLIWFWNNECCDLDFTTVHCCRLREQSRLSYSYESFINMRKRQGKEREVWRKQQLQYSPSWIPEKHSSHSRLCVCVCVCVNIWSCVYSSLPLTFSISAKLSIQLRPITYNHLIEAVWMLLHLSSSDSWVSANEMILILGAVHVLCALVNCVIICTVYTSLHAYSRWCVEGVDEGERYVRMLQFTLAV